MAAGLLAEDAAIIVSLGALRRLDRDELSGVVAHELAHILNGDMRRFTIMAGWLHGLFVLQMLSRRALQSVARSRLLALSLALMALGWLGGLLGRLIQAAFCRRRESLADATAAQLTRDPKALAGALKKIGGLERGSLIKAPAMSGLNHFFLAKPDRGGLMSSHPPLAERIWALDPSWDGWYHDFEADPVNFLAEPPKKAPSR
jgi:Zn-dependent protease with chaperone function